MTSFQSWIDGSDDSGYNDGHGDDDDGDNADLNRRLLLVLTCPTPSTACDGPLKSCVME